MLPASIRLFPYNFIFFMTLFGNSMIMPIIGPLVLNHHALLLSSTDGFGIRDLVYSLSILLPGMVMLIATPVISNLSDYLNRKNCLLFSISCGFLSYLLTLLSLEINNLTLFLLGRMIGGIAVAGVALAQAEIIRADHFHKVKNLSRAMIYAMFGYIFGSMVAGLSNGNFSHFLTIKTAFFIGMFLTFTNLLAVLYFTADIKNHKNTPLKKNILVKISQETYRMLTKPNVSQFCLLVLICSVAWNIQALYLSFYLSYQYHYTQVDISLIFGYVAINCFFAYIILSKFLIHRLSMWDLLFLSSLLITLSSLLLAIANSSWLVCLAISCLSIGIIIGQSTQIGQISTYVSDHEQGKISGIINTVYSLAVCLGISIANISSELLISLPFISSFLIAITGLIFLGRHKKLILRP